MRIVDVLLRRAPRTPPPRVNPRLSAVEARAEDANTKTDQALAERDRLGSYARVRLPR